MSDSFAEGLYKMSIRGSLIEPVRLDPTVRGARSDKLCQLEKSPFQALANTHINLATG